MLTIYFPLLKYASSSVRMRPPIGHSTVVKQKTHLSQCTNHKYTFLSHCPQVQRGRKKFN